MTRIAQLFEIEVLERARDVHALGNLRHRIFKAAGAVKQHDIIVRRNALIPGCV